MRACVRLGAAIAALAGLAACAQTDGAPASATALAPTPLVKREGVSFAAATVALVSLDGAPEATAQEFRDALARQFAAHDIAGAGAREARYLLRGYLPRVRRTAAPGSNMSSTFSTGGASDRCASATRSRRKARAMRGVKCRRRRSMRRRENAPTTSPLSYPTRRRRKPRQLPRSSSCPPRGKRRAGRDQRDAEPVDAASRSPRNTTPKIATRATLSLSIGATRAASPSCSARK